MFNHRKMVKKRILHESIKHDNTNRSHEIKIKYNSSTMYNKLK